MNKLQKELYDNFCDVLFSLLEDGYELREDVVIFILTNAFYILDIRCDAEINKRVNFLVNSTDTESNILHIFDDFLKLYSEDKSDESLEDKYQSLGKLINLHNLNTVYFDLMMKYVIDKYVDDVFNYKNLAENIDVSLLVEDSINELASNIKKNDLKKIKK